LEENPNPQITPEQMEAIHKQVQEEYAILVHQQIIDAENQPLVDIAKLQELKMIKEIQMQHYWEQYKQIS